MEIKLGINPFTLRTLYCHFFGLIESTGNLPGAETHWPDGPPALSLDRVPGRVGGAEVACPEGTWHRIRVTGSLGTLVTC